MNWWGIFPYLYELVGDISQGYFPTCMNWWGIVPYLYELVGDISLPV